MEDTVTALANKIAELAKECGRLEPYEAALLSNSRQMETLRIENAARKARMEMILIHIQDAREHIIPSLDTNATTEWISEFIHMIHQILTENDNAFVARVAKLLPDGSTLRTNQS